MLSTGPDIPYSTTLTHSGESFAGELTNGDSS
jgi:hypothetical protein